MVMQGQCFTYVKLIFTVKKLKVYIADPKMFIFL